MSRSLAHLLGLFCAFCAFCGPSLASAEIPAFTPDGFRVPQPKPTFTFPRDHGSHPDYKIEWWYLTGHLFTNEATPRRFGFQATFFRSAAPRDVAARPAPDAFAHDQIYLAHMALVDVATGRFLYQERLNRAGWDAFASTETLDVHNGDWSLRLAPPPSPPSPPKPAPDPSALQSRRQSMIDHLPLAGEPAPQTIRQSLIDDGIGGAGPEVLRLVGGIRAEARFTLDLTSTKPLVRFGEDGYSRKGSAPTAASYYLTFSRLAVAGQLSLGDAAPLAVTGQAWMDHEYSSSQLDENQVGWDWLSAQLHDGRELMFYALRRRDGSLDPASTLTWIDREGRTAKAPYRWEPQSFWTSPHTGARYPQRIRLVTTDPADGRELTFIVVPFHPDQELQGHIGGVTYWEGACQLLAADGKTELGSAYMELTGYDKPVDVVR